MPTKGQRPTPPKEVTRETVEEGKPPPVVKKAVPPGKGCRMVETERDTFRFFDDEKEVGVIVRGTEIGRKVDFHISVMRGETAYIEWILGEIIRVARERGFASVLVVTDNKMEQALLEKTGFKKVGVVKSGPVYRYEISPETPKEPEKPPEKPPKPPEKPPKVKPSEPPPKRPPTPPPSTKPEEHEVFEPPESDLRFTLEMANGNYLVKMFDDSELVAHATGNFTVLGAHTLYIPSITVYDPRRYMEKAIVTLKAMAVQIGVPRLAIWMQRMKYRIMLLEKGFVESEGDYRIFVFDTGVERPPRPPAPSPPEEPEVERPPKPRKPPTPIPHLEEVEDEIEAIRIEENRRRADLVRRLVYEEMGTIGGELDIDVQVDGDKIIISAAVRSEYQDRWDAEEWEMKGDYRESHAFITKFVSESEKLRRVLREYEIMEKKVTSRILSTWEDIYTVITGELEREIPTSHENLMKMYEAGKVISNPYTEPIVEIVVPREEEERAERIVSGYRLDVAVSEAMAQEPSLEVLKGESSFQFYLEIGERLDSCGYDILGIIHALENEEIPYVVTASRAVEAKIKF